MSNAQQRRPSSKGLAAGLPDEQEWADELHVREIAEFAQGLPEKFLYCREMGHNWRPYTAGRFKDGGYERTLRCSRCRTQRVQEISARGVVLRNNYVHPDGYLSPAGMGRIVGEGRGALRLESIKRIVSKEVDD